MKYRTDITQEQLKQNIKYNPQLGVFYRKLKSGWKELNGTKTTKGYLLIATNKRQYLAHRLAWLYVYGEWPKDQLDHINGIRTDNRIENLREVSQTGNNRNMIRNRNNKTGIMGVYWCKQTQKWKVQINNRDRKEFGGRHDDFFEACCARKRLENKHNFHNGHNKEIEVEQRTLHNKPSLCEGLRYDEKYKVWRVRLSLPNRQYKDLGSYTNLWDAICISKSAMNYKEKGLPIPNHRNHKVFGVSQSQKKWVSQITVNKIKIRLGETKDFFEAVCLRKSAENKYDFHR